MNLEKAVELLGDMVTFRYSARQTDDGDAIKLGIQALRRLMEHRKYHRDVTARPLPGETPYD